MRTLSLLLITAVVCSAAVTPPDQLKVPPGFKVELLREAGPDEGSWICMAKDDQDRLYISTQGKPKDADQKADGKWGGMWRARFVSTENPTGNIQPHVIAWEKVNVPVGDAMGMLWAFDSLYVSGNGPQGRGIYRCTSSKHDDHLDYATLFKAIPGGAGEHGAHAIVLGPGGKLYIMNGNSTGILDGLSPDSPYRNWGEDDLLPRLRDPVATFFDKIKAPYGCVYRTDADGTKWELFAGGFRNPYDIAFNPDGELFTYDADMEWDRGLPWYRPTRILHVVPGGEYGFREGSAKWPAYFPDSLPAVADIGVGCPTGMKFGTETKGWPEKYRRALFLHDWTYGRILAVTLHEKGASYTARNDLASYTYPRDAEANGDVEVFLSGKGMPVTDLEFLRDGSMVFTVGGRGTAAALYRVSYVGKSDAASAPEAQRKLAGGAASEPSATTGSPSAKATAPDGARGADRAVTAENIDRLLRTEIAARKREEDQALKDAEDPNLKPGIQKGLYVEKACPAIRAWLELFEKGGIPNGLDRHGPIMYLSSGDTFTRYAARLALEATPTDQWRKTAQDQAFRFLDHLGSVDADLNALFALTRVGRNDDQAGILLVLSHFPLNEMPDGLKLLKLRVLELSFARQGRPSEQLVKAVMEELLAHYPVPPIPANAATPARNPAAGAPVDAPTWRMNRELCALLTWLSNPELGELNANLLGKPADKPAGKSPESPKAPALGPSGGKTGSFRRKDRFSAEFASVSLESPQANGTKAHAFTEKTHAFASKADASSQKTHAFDVDTHVSETKAHASESKAHAFDSIVHAFFIKAHASTEEADAFAINAHAFSENADVFTKKACAFTANTDAFDVSASPDAPPAPANEQSASSVSHSDASKGASGSAFGPTGSAFAASAPLFAQTAPTTAKPDTLPTEAPPVVAKTPNSGLGPVPNPGADIFPGRKGAAFHAELGRQVIEKTLALMDAAPSQEEQVWYAFCLRWAHGWTPEQRVRYFRWFHEKTVRYTGGNSFVKFAEAIRADAESRVPESERAALADWLRPLASPRPAVLKPRAFVKAWTLPDIEAALDKLKDRKPDLARGKDLYTQAQCAQCHLFHDAGGNVGPDLTAVAQRFGRHDILESITDPSKVVSEQYAMVTLTILDGKGGTAEVSGLVKEDTSATVTLLTDPLAGKTSHFYKNVIVKREKAAVSIMPPGLLYTLTAEEVADLLALFGAK